MTAFYKCMAFWMDSLFDLSADEWEAAGLAKRNLAHRFSLFIDRMGHPFFATINNPLTSSPDCFRIKASVALTSSMP